MSTSFHVRQKPGGNWPRHIYQVIRVSEKKTQVGFIFVLILLVGMGVGSYQATHKLREAAQREAQLTTAIAKLETITSLLNDADDAQRSYVMTGEQRYVQPFHDQVQAIDRDLRDLRVLVADYFGQQQKIDELQPLIATQLAEIAKTIAVREREGFEPAQQMILAQEDEHLTDDIDTFIEELRNNQEQALIQRAIESDARERDMILNISLGSFVAIVIAAYAALLINRAIRNLKQIDRNLRKSRDQLEIILQGVADGITVHDSTNLLIYANAAAARALGYPTVSALLATPATEMMQRLEIADELGQPLLATQLPEQALRGEQSAETILRFRTVATDEERWMVVKTTPAFDEHGHVQYTISIFHDITERVQAYQTLERRVEERTHEIERRRKVAEGLRDIMTILNSNRPLDEILGSIVTQACLLLGTDACAVYHLREQRDLLCVQVARGLDSGDAAVAIPIGWGAVGKAAALCEPVASSNMLAARAPGEDPALEPLQSARLASLFGRYGALLAVPLMVKDDIYGAIALYYYEPREFTREETKLAVAFSDQAALAIENARLRTQAEQIAVAAERSRLARDLHDAVTQTLFSTSLIADVLPRLWERNRAEARCRLEELRQLTRSALAEMRTLLLELRPASLTEVGIGELLRQLTEATAGRARVPIVLTVEGQYQLPADVQIALYRIAQEALNNVARHAGANHVAVRLCCKADQIELRISDDGHGFDPHCVAMEHLGLRIMHERAESISADLRLESQPGCGTQVTITWP
ncbi:MAG: CHASE3 domain-containing protein [Kouleothrix sp.]|nr:CHASE3 domain-containing protein [Kouleothrix sp.]